VRLSFWKIECELTRVEGGGVCEIKRVALLAWNIVNLSGNLDN
jgi:hypothetical protein